jgi:DNA invertase Pin-like site-specific DNA recombinase
MASAAAYLRVSSQHQADEDRFGYHRQIAGITEYCARAGLTLAAEYRDAITGKSVTRDGLTRLRREAGRYDAVVISSVDRLARDVGMSYQVLANLLASGLQVHSADHGLIDLEQEASLIQFNLQALFAHLERQKITQRTRAARNAIAASGGIPNGMRMLGYRTVKRVPEIVPTEAAVVREVFERSAAGETSTSIANWLNELEFARLRGGGAWRFNRVGEILKNTAYKGEYRWGAYVIPVPAIVSASVWLRAQPRGRARPWHTSPLQLLGHVRCGRCGNRLSSRKHHTGPYWSYRCIGKVLVKCDLPIISGRHLDPIAEEAVRGALADRKLLRDMLSAAGSVDVRREEQVAALQDEDARWLEAFRAGAITSVELGRYREDVRRRLRALGGEARPAADVSAYARAAKRMPLRELLDLADVEVVVLDRDDVEVRLGLGGT